MTYIHEPQARVLQDSLHRGHRVTTMEVTMHRFILAEFNTHRAFCLAGDTELEFDLPAGRGPGRRVYKMRLDDFVDKWKNGATTRNNKPKKDYDLSGIEDKWYSSQELSTMTGMTKSPIHNSARLGYIDSKIEGSTVYVHGPSFVKWRMAPQSGNRQDVRSRLSSMQIRQLNEETGLIQNSTVTDAMYSGHKEVFEVRAGEFSVTGSKDHRIMTTEGYKTIEQLVPGETQIVVRKFGVLESDRTDEKRLKFVDGAWRSVYQRDMRDILLEEHGGCQECGRDTDLHVHHTVPVHKAPELAYVYSNLELLCSSHHQSRHSTQGWQVSQYLYGSSVRVESVESQGFKDTYDLSIAGDYPNFLANGVVVHNSRNSASSRAIPGSLQRERVLNTPAMPSVWPSKQRGMQGGPDVAPELADSCDALWDRAAHAAVDYALQLDMLGVHKSITNRLLEPFLFQTIIVTGDTASYDNFFLLRCHEDAQPEIRIPAELMLDAYSKSVPKELDINQWHAPLLQVEDIEPMLDYADEHGIRHDILATKVSAARCARVSYLTHDGKRDIQADLDLYERLTSAGHWSPLEHVLTPNKGFDPQTGNVKGWTQLRHKAQNHPYG